MQMVRQNHHRINFKRMSGFNRLKSATQTIDIFHQKPTSFSFSQVYGEKPCSSWHINTTVISHCFIVKVGVSIHANDAVRTSPHPTNFLVKTLYDKTVGCGERSEPHQSRNYSNGAVRSSPHPTALLRLTDCALPRLGGQRWQLGVTKVPTLFRRKHPE